MNKNDLEFSSLGKLHFTEIKLIELIRRQREGKIFISIKNGLPMSGFVSERKVITFT